MATQGFLQALLFFVAFSACNARETFTEVASDPIPLLGGLSSYVSPEAAAHVIERSRWLVVEDTSLPPDDRRPPFSILTVSVLPFADRGVTGEMRLHIFNGRLASTSFYPDDARKYQLLLGGDAPTTRLGGELRGSYLRAWSAKDYETRAYVLHGDDRLLSQQNRWIEKYS